jgi:hypothetical protein
MNKLKTGVLTLGLLLGSYSFAQSQEAAEKAQKQGEHLAKELDLSAEQKEKVVQLSTGIFQKNEAVYNNEKLSSDDKKAQLQGNNNALRSQLKTILTEEQYNTYISTVEPKMIHAEPTKKKEEK